MFDATPPGQTQHADVGSFLQFLARLLEHAVGTGRPFGENLLSVGDQQPHARPRFAGAHVFGEHENFVARTFHDQVEIALDQERRGFERLAADLTASAIAFGLSGPSFLSAASFVLRQLEPFSAGAAAGCYFIRERQVDRVFQISYSAYLGTLNSKVWSGAIRAMSSPSTPWMMCILRK